MTTKNENKNKHTTTAIGGDVVRDNEIYIVTDNSNLKNLVLSSTLLRPGKSTSGHKHEGQEEVYIFIRGNGTMQLDNNSFPVAPGDLITVEDGVFHRVFNDDNILEMYFICVFDGKRVE